MAVALLARLGMRTGAGARAVAGIALRRDIDGDLGRFTVERFLERDLHVVAQVGAASLLVGVAALTTLIALQSAFRAGAEGTALGDVISVQVRGVDYLAAAVTIALGAFAVADIAYLNIAERTAEIGTLRSVGWSEGHIRRLFATEAFATAFLGAASGAAIAVAATAFALPAVPITTSLQAAALALSGGTLAAMIATTGPVARLHRIAPAAALSQ